MIFTIDEAAEFLKVSRHTIRNLVRAKKIPGGKIGGQWRLRKEDLEKFLQTQYQTSDAV